jgi:hypothetical protein
MKFRLILSLLALLSCSPVAHAELVFNISEEIISPTQTNLLVSISGSVDTDGLTYVNASFFGSSSFNPQQPSIVSRSGNIDTYTLPNGLSSLGTALGFPTIADVTGDVVGFGGFTDSLFVPQNYVSETPLSASMTVVDHNFDDFNLIAGESYSTSWAVGTADEDSLTVNIAPESTNFTISPSIVNGQFVISYTSDSGFSYQLEQSGNLNSGSWTNHGSAVVGNDATNSFTINPADATLRYYRVQSHVQE